jgi:hypothetical protein
LTDCGELKGGLVMADVIHVRDGRFMANEAFDIFLVKEKLLFSHVP